MPSRPREISSLGIYHVVYRGVNKQQIFEDEDDYGKFLTVLRKYQPICGYKIIAYCLMSNHVHLLIKPDKIPLAGIFTGITKDTSGLAVFSSLASEAARSITFHSSSPSSGTFTRIRSRRRYAITLRSIDIVVIKTILTTI